MGITPEKLIEIVNEAEKSDRESKQEHPWDTEEENLRFVRIWLEMKTAKSTACSTGG